ELIPTADPGVLGVKFFSTPGQDYVLDFYSNQAPSPSGYGQGETYLGSVSLANLASAPTVINWRIPHFVAGLVYSATATNVTTGDTSEFSAVPLTVFSMSPLAGPVGTR